MTTNQPDRLDRIEAIVESNARSIQALGDSMAEMRLVHADFMASQQQINERLTAVQEGLAGMASNIDQTQPTILQKLNSIQGKLDELLRRQE